MTITEFLNGILPALSELLVAYTLFLSLGSLMGIALFIVSGIGLYKMSVKLGFSCPWISFIPIVSCYSLGRIASKYIKRDGTRSAKFNIWLLVFYILTDILLIALFAFLIVAAVTVISGVMSDNLAVAEIIRKLIPVIILYFFAMASAITFNVLYYIAFWRCISLFDGNNATLYTVLSVFFKFLAPIFILLTSLKEEKIESVLQETDQITVEH